MDAKGAAIAQRSVGNDDRHSRRSVRAGANPDLVLSSTIHLMTHYLARQDDIHENRHLATAIARHLAAIADRSDLAPVLRATCQHLTGQWTEIARETSRPAGKVSMWKRFLAWLSCRLNGLSAGQ